MKKRIPKIVLTLAFFAIHALIGCTTLSNKPQESDLPGTYYIVKEGDTLTYIANKYRVSIKEIIEINGIKNPRMLTIGQPLFLPDMDPISRHILRLKNMKTRQKRHNNKPKAKQKPPQTIKRNHLSFPVKNGKIVRNFSKNKKSPYDGIGIKAPLGSPIRAAAKGKVIFAGDDGTRFGLILIIEHGPKLITVYTHLRKVFVKKESIVKRNQIVGSLGQSGGISAPLLHFQVRVNERPQNPLHFVKP